MSYRNLRSRFLGSALTILVVVTLPVAARAQADMTNCKSSAMAEAVAAGEPMAPPMPMPKLKADEPMVTGMAKDTDVKGDVGKQAAMQEKCMDGALMLDQSMVDKKK
jgi:Fe2+ transport system protein B